MADKYAWVWKAGQRMRVSKSKEIDSFINKHKEIFNEYFKLQKELREL